jgi:hypothetical protein
MSYEQLIELALQAEENRRELFPDSWDEPELMLPPKRYEVYLPGDTGPTAQNVEE